MVKENVKRNKSSDEICLGKTKLDESTHFLFHILMKFQSTDLFTYSLKKYFIEHYHELGTGKLQVYNSEPNREVY